MKNVYTKTIRLAVVTVLYLFTTIGFVYAQNGVRIAATTGTADASAMLDVVSTNKGFLVPRVPLTGPALTNPLPVTSPADGLLVYNTGGGGVAAKGFYYWDASLPAWVQLTAGGLSGSGTTNYVTKWTNTTSLGNSQIFDNGTNVGVGTTGANAKLEVQAGNIRITSAADAKYEFFGSGITSDRGFVGWQSSAPVGVYLWNRDNSPLYFGTTNTEKARIDLNGNMGIGTTAPTNKLQVAGEVVRTNTRVDNAEKYPVAHSSNGTNLLMIDPTWSNSELQAYFNTGSSTTTPTTYVEWENDATAPAGWCIKVIGAVNVGGQYGSGFPYIPVEADATYYMECWIRTTSGTNTHYMGSNEYNESFASLGGNPGSFGYWVMNASTSNGTWKKVSGYISGFHASTVGKFELGTKYWTPMALFNYSSGGTCFISGWTVTKVSGASPLPRRDYRPYGTPTYYWDGSSVACATGNTALSVRGAATLDNTSYCAGTGWNYKKMFGFNSMTQEAQANSTPPANGWYITMPATTGVHNTMFLSTIDQDRWSTISVWLCNSAGTTCTKIGRSANNANGAGTASTYTLGPYNNVKETAAHAWVNFPVTADQVATYISGGNLKFLVTSGPNNTNGGQLWISGFALAPNSNGFTQQPALPLYYALNGVTVGEIGWNSVWNNDGLAQVPANSSSVTYVKVMDPTRDLIVTFHEHDGGWHGSSPNITVGTNTTVFRPSRGIVSMSSTLYNNKSYMSSQSIVIPASIVAAQMTSTSSGVGQLIRLNIQNTGASNYHIRGIDTEVYY